MRPPLTLVQHSTLPALPVHPDTRAAAAVEAAVLSARKLGYSRGERAGHVAGWRSGWLCGACWGCLLTGIAVGAARAWGWL